MVAKVMKEALRYPQKNCRHISEFRNLFELFAVFFYKNTGEILFHIKENNRY